MKIQLNEEEEKIFEIIKKHSLKFNPIVTPRAAGGWVRDKLLSRECNDIDIALDTISGYDFALSLSKSVEGFDFSLGKIKSNPEKSKHLETAVLKINNYFIDFNNLRTEEYADTRIPSILMGTPHEDALRRDLTINSLFYNLINEEIEDFTQKGIEDIKNRNICTPIDPLQTFMDDPLRILRSFRFSCQLDFKINDKIYKALEDKSLKIALNCKVSNERIGIEINKIIKTDNPYSVLLDIVRYELYDPIFKPIVEKELKFEDIENIKSNMEKVEKKLNFKPENQIKNIYYILINYFGKFVIKNGHKIFINTHICKFSLMFPNSFSNLITNIENSYIFLKNTTFSTSKIDVIRTIRHLNSHWQTILYLYTAFSISSLELVCNFYEVVFKFNLQNCYLIKANIRGDVLRDRLGLIDKQISKYLEVYTIYQILEYKEEDILNILYDMKNKEI